MPIFTKMSEMLDFRHLRKPRLYYAPVSGRVCVQKRSLECPRRQVI